MVTHMSWVEGATGRWKEWDESKSGQGGEKAAPLRPPAAQRHGPHMAMPLCLRTSAGPGPTTRDKPPNHPKQTNTKRATREPPVSPLCADPSYICLPKPYLKDDVLIPWRAPRHFKSASLQRPR